MKNRCIILTTVVCCLFISAYAQRSQVNTANISLSREGKSNGFDYKGVTFKYQFVNCGGDVQVMVDFEKNATYTKFWYNKKAYSKNDIGADLWPESNQYNIGEIFADLYFENTFFGKVNLNYIVGNFAGCFGETYQVIKDTGKDPTLALYKSKINSFSLRNIKVSGGGDPITSRYYKIIERLNKKEADIIKQKKEAKLNAEVDQLLRYAYSNLQIARLEEAKKDFQKAYNLKKDPKILEQIKAIDQRINDNNKNSRASEKINQANTFIDNEDYDKALALLNEAYAINPSSEITNQIEAVKLKISNKEEDAATNSANTDTNKENTVTQSASSGSSSSASSSASTSKNTSNKTTTKKATTSQNKSTTVTRPKTIGNTGKTYEQLEYEKRLYQRQQKEKLQRAIDPGGYAMEKSGANAFFQAQRDQIEAKYAAKRAREERERREDERAERERRRRERIREEKYRREQEALNIKRAEEQRLADIKLKEDRNKWELTNAPIFRKELEQWHTAVKTYINSDLSKYRLFKGDKLPHWLDILRLGVDRMIVSETMTPSEKKLQINIAWGHANKYRELCRKYNFQGRLEPNTENSLTKIFEYTRSNNGYDALSQSFSYGITNKEEPITNTITNGDPYYSSILGDLYQNYANNSNLKLKKGVYASKITWRYYAEKWGRNKAGFRTDKSFQPYLYRPLLKEHLDFLDDFEQNVPTTQIISPFHYGEYFIKPYRMRAVHYYSLHDRQKEMLSEYYTLLSLMNIPNIEAFMKLPISRSKITSPTTLSATDFKLEEIDLENASNTSRKKLKKVVQKSQEITFSVAHALYLNGYFKESEVLFKQLYDIGVKHKQIDNYNRIFSEALSLYLASLYHQGKYQEVVSQGPTFKAVLSSYDNSGKPNNILSYFQLYMNRAGMDIRQDIYGHTVYARGMGYWALALAKLGDTKEAIKVMNPIKKGLKEDVRIDHYYSEVPLITQFFKEFDPKTYEKYIAGVPITTKSNPIERSVQLQEQQANPQKWQNQYQTTIDSLNFYYKEKSYKKVVNLGRQLLPSLHFEAAQENLEYQKVMQLCAEASLYEGTFGYGITFANYSLNRSKQPKSMVLLLLNALFLNNGNIQLAGIEPKGIDGFKDTYHLVTLLESYASEQIDGDTGKNFLKNIENRMTKNKVENVFVPYVYHVLNKI